MPNILIKPCIRQAREPLIPDGLDLFALVEARIADKPGAIVNVLLPISDLDAEHVASSPNGIFLGEIGNVLEGPRQAVRLFGTSWRGHL